MKTLLEYYFPLKLEKGNDSSNNKKTGEINKLPNKKDSPRYLLPLSLRVKPGLAQVEAIVSVAAFGWSLWRGESFVRRSFQYPNQGEAYARSTMDGWIIVNFIFNLLIMFIS